MAEKRMVTELESYAVATHEVGHEIVACCLHYEGTGAISPTMLVKVSRDEFINPVFRNALAELASGDLQRVNFWGQTTVPNKSVARLLENLSEAGERAVAFLIASRPQAPGKMMTTHMCWANLSGDEGAIDDVIACVMEAWNKSRK